MKLYNQIFILLLSIFITACNSGQNNGINNELITGDATPDASDQKMMVTPTTDAIVETKNNENISASFIDKKKIIKDGYLSVKSINITESKKFFDEHVKQLKGYYENESMENTDYNVSYNLKIRVPSDNFEKLISGIENGKNEIVSKSIQARDVTEEFIDIESRITNKREYLKRYKDLLAKASNVKDILAIEESIRIIQEEIESREGRLKFLNDQVSYSTLNVYLFQQKEYVHKPKPQDKFIERVKTAVSNGWYSVVNFFLWVISLWPYLILVVVAIAVYKRIRRKKQQL
ncbi:MAG: DUF4349 domain-containing protein [Bacteroidia bacterium]